MVVMNSDWQGRSKLNNWGGGDISHTIKTIDFKRH